MKASQTSEIPWLESMAIFCLLALAFLGFLLNSSVVGAWLGGASAAVTDPLLLIGALIIGCIVKPSWLMACLALAWAVIVGIIIVFFIRYWEKLGMEQPNPVSLDLLTASLFVASSTSLVLWIIRRSLGQNQ